MWTWISSLLENDWGGAVWLLWVDTECTGNMRTQSFKQQKKKPSKNENTPNIDDSAVCWNRNIKKEQQNNQRNRDKTLPDFKVWKRSPSTVFVSKSFKGVLKVQFLVQLVLDERRQNHLITLTAAPLATGAGTGGTGRTVMWQTHCYFYYYYYHFLSLKGK